MNLVLRTVIGALGVAAGVYGALLLWDQGTDNLFQAGKWLIGGVILHDGVIGPAVIVLGAIAAKVLPGRIPGPVIIGGIVLGSVTLVAWPVLGRFGARPDNASLLPREYVTGWWIFAALTLLAVAVAVVAGRRSAKDVDDGARTGS